MSNNNPFKTKEFKALKDKFYKKLADSGFEEIEDVNSPNEYLKTWHSNYFQTRHSPNKFKEISEYYRKAQEILHTFNFEDKQSKTIWQCHANGLSIRAIAKELNLKIWVVHKYITKVNDLFFKPMTNYSINLVTVRHGTIDDEALIYSSWLRPLYYDNIFYGRIFKNTFFHKYPIAIKEILKKSCVRIACLKDSPDVVLGYCVTENDRLHWIYVKKAWRRLGIARKLIPNHITTYSHYTKLAKNFIPKEWIFDPFLY